MIATAGRGSALPRGHGPALGTTAAGTRSVIVTEIGIEKRIAAAGATAIEKTKSAAAETRRKAAAPAAVVETRIRKKAAAAVEAGDGTPVEAEAEAGAAAAAATAAAPVVAATGTTVTLAGVVLACCLLLLLLLLPPLVRIAVAYLCTSRLTSADMAVAAGQDDPSPYAALVAVVAVAAGRSSSPRRVVDGEGQEGATTGGRWTASASADASQIFSSSN